jgi:hypothetical protein
MLPVSHAAKTGAAALKRIDCQVTDASFSDEPPAL